MVNVDLKDYETYSHINEYGFINVQPAYAVYVSGGYVKFSLRLPKIPATIYNKIVSLFKKQAQLFNTECLARVFWDIEEEKYCISVPVQQASIASVYPLKQEYDDWLLTHIPVLEVHSHGIAFNAFWSSTDDADEVNRNLLYGVFSFNHGIDGEEMSLFRCCNGSNDRIINLSKEQLFEPAPFEYDSKFVRSVMNSGKIVTI